MTATADLVLRTETYGPPPDFEHRARRRRRALKTGRSTGHVIRRAVNERNLKGWLLSWNKAQPGVRVHLREMWRLALGDVLPMAYTPVGKTDVDALDVRFVEGTLAFRQDGLNTFAIQVEIEEAFR